MCGIRQKIGEKEALFLFYEFLIKLKDKMIALNVQVP